MKDPVFTLHTGTYRFYLGGVLKYETNEVAVVIDSDVGVLLKHGPTQLVRPDFDKLRAGLGDYVVMVVSSSWLLEDLNKLVTISDYGLKVLEKIKAMQSDG